jgi:gamma-glutamyltranspeptidase/glutathione hydrolase
VLLPLGVLALVALRLPSPARAAYPTPAEGTSFAASTDHSDATRAAMDVMGVGGNAVDGAIAAALVLGVVNPSASGFGGGGFAVVYSARDKRATVLDFRETAPRGLDVESIAGKRLGERARGATVGVPGEPAGLELMSKRWAKRSLADDAAPAVALATRGFYVSRHLADATGWVLPRIKQSPELSATFAPTGSPIGYATLVRRPELGRTLARFGAEGKSAAYSGPVAQRIVDAVRASGGKMDLVDLADYTVRERAPLTRTIDGKTIVTMPAPSAGGLMLLETLGMHGASPSSGLAQHGNGSSAYFHVLAETMRGALADRIRFATDPDLEPAVDRKYDAALAPAQLAARKAKIDLQKTRPAPEWKTQEHGTSHLVTWDYEGNVVSLTTTVNGPFGAQVVAGDTGILLNNELDDFSTAEDIQGFGVVGLGPNRPRPRARPVSSMTPVIVLDNGVPVLALGGSGGQRIATGVTQGALCRLVFGLDPSACVSQPRVHVTTNALFVDPEIAPDVRAGLEARGETLKDESFHPALEMIALDTKAPGKPRLLAASDPRKGGFAAAR